MRLLTAITALLVASPLYAEKLILTGELSSTAPTLVSAPFTMGNTWNKKILWLQSEGTIVKKGEPVVRFDPGSLLEAIEREEQQLEAKVAQNVVENSQNKIALADAELKVRTNERNLEKARLELSKITTYSSKKEVADAQFEVAKAISELKEAQVALENTREKQRLGKIAQDAAVEKLKASLQLSEDSKQLMELTAPADALLVYIETYQGGVSRKVQSGDSVDTGEPVAKLLPLDGMMIKAYVNEVDTLYVTDGQAVDVVFDARPEQQFSGTVLNKARYSTPVKKRGTGRWVELNVRLDQSLDDWMHAGMNARIEVAL